jgi:ABC-type multidrug transport system ATPase subunit
MAGMVDTAGLIRFVNVSKYYRTFPAVSKLNLEIRKGEILGFLGPNGAGKTTTIKMLAGLINPTEGEILIKRDGNWVKLTTGTRYSLAEQMGFLIELPTFYETLSPRTILTYYAKLSGYPRPSISGRIEELIRMMGLQDWIDKPIKEFSKGMRQRLGIIAAIIHNPTIVVLDEPQSGLDPQGQKEMRDFIRHLRDEGKTIFISSHFLYEISEIADRIAIISHGNLVAVDALENLEIGRQYSVIKVKILPKVDAESAGQVINAHAPRIAPLTGLGGEPGFMSFNAETHQFEIKFNGQAENQHAILKSLIEGGLQVTEFSAPRASRLEDIYIELVKDEEDSNHQTRGRNE